MGSFVNPLCKAENRRDAKGWNAEQSECLVSMIRRTERIFHASSLYVAGTKAVQEFGTAWWWKRDGEFLIEPLVGEKTYSLPFTGARTVHGTLARIVTLWLMQLMNSGRTGNPGETHFR
jgi:hypothetical protein